MPSRDEALEAIDFIVNVLKEHEKDLDKLISELGTVVERMGDTGALNMKVEKVEERLTTLQSEIANLINYLSNSPDAASLRVPQIPQVHEKTPNSSPIQTETRGPPVILRCRQWEDFLALAHDAQTVSFQHREAEKTFQADALRNNQIITYNGELPKTTLFLKTWLSKQLSVDEKRILEGVLAIG